MPSKLDAISGCVKSVDDVAVALLKVKPEYLISSEPSSNVAFAIDEPVLKDNMIP